MKKPLKIALLWHMHQPSYLDPDTGRYLMPWTRLHAIRDYYDMALYVEKNPGVKVTFNYVPSLWEQIFDQAEGRKLDEHERISRKSAEELDESEKIFIACEFFHCQDHAMINPYPRFRQLRLRYKLNRAAILEAPVQDLRDICVWFHLAWCGRSMLEEPLIIDLYRKGRDFSEEDKIALMDRIRERLSDILPLHRKLQEEGRIEISTTPYFHPILPLLIDTEAAHKALPQMPLPQESFSLAGDARRQIQLAVAQYEYLFGHKPGGFWPSEGSLSPETAAMLSSEGIGWAATDEEVLWRSLGNVDRSAARLCRPYRYAGLTLFFRDHGLSDKIGFNYGNMPPEDAVADFIGNLHNMRAALPDDGRDYVVPVILDGENCWEYYKDFGAPFLNSLYKRLAEDPQLESVTFSDAAGLWKDNADSLPNLHSGSWIFADFCTWIGDEVKNRAWKYLFRARKAAEEALAEGSVSEEARGQLWDHIFSAEGSDWFWWFGEGHNSDQDELFDLLFRKRLSAIYRSIGSNPPSYLSEPVDTRGHMQRLRYEQPRLHIHPEISGRKGRYWDWHGAGTCIPQAGAMQRSSRDIGKLIFGFNSERFYFRIESPLLKNPGSERLAFRLSFTKPVNMEIILPVNKEQRRNILEDSGVRWVFDDFLDVSIPFERLKSAADAEAIEFHAGILEKGIEIERLPEDSGIILPFPSARFDEENWLV